MLQLGWEGGFGGREGIGELFGAAGADDGCGDGWVGHDPGDGEGGEGEPGFGGDGAEFFDGLEHAVVPVSLLVDSSGGAEGETGAFLGSSGAVLSGEEAPGEGVVRDDADTLLGAQRKELAFDFAEEEVVAGLDGIEACGPENLAAADGAGDLVGEEVGAADVADFARADEVIERPEGFVDGGVGVGAVELVEVDVVGAEPAEGGVDGVEDVLSGVALVPGERADAAEAFGGEDDALAIAGAGEPPSENLFGSALCPGRGSEWVDVGGIDEGDAALEGAVQDGERGGLVALEAEGHGAEAEAGNGEACSAEAGVLHAGIVPQEVATVASASVARSVDDLFGGADGGLGFVERVGWLGRCGRCCCSGLDIGAVAAGCGGADEGECEVAEGATAVGGAGTADAGLARGLLRLGDAACDATTHPPASLALCEVYVEEVDEEGQPEDEEEEHRLQHGCSLADSEAAMESGRP